MMSLIASKHRRSSFQGDYTVSFVGGGENGPPDSRSTRETCPYEMTERTSRMVTPPVFQDDCSSVATSADSRDRLSDTHSIRVLKQMPLPDWMKIFVPRTVRIQTGPEPFMEYTRSEHGEVRQRKLITVATSAERLPKNILAINFNSSEIDKMSASSPRSTASSTSTKPTVSDRNSKVNTDRWVLKFDSKRDRDIWARLVQDAVELLAWINKFTLGGEVITTKNSSVFECFTWMDHDTPSFVLKSMTADSKTKTQVARNEIHVHHLLTNFSTHPNIVNLHDSFRQQDKAYLVLENCVGGDLFEFISQNGAVDERAAKTLFRRIANAINYVHDQGIVHLDIKPENLFFKASPSQLDTIKLGDFGSAMVLEDVKRGKAALSCTLGYAAPEILEDGDVSFAADVFSAGAVLYMILCGYPPFSAPSEQEILEKTLRCDIEFFEPDWWNVSKEAKGLIRGMMHVDPSQRLSMQEVLEHPWLASVGFFVYL